MEVFKLTVVVVLVIIFLCGCSQTAYQSEAAQLLSTDDLIDITLRAPEGSGSVRTLTLRYMDNGKEKTGTLGEVRRVDIAGYDDEAREQTFSVSDSDGDGIVELIVYREFWFPDITVSHPGIPEWPTVYEYDTAKGFMVASVRHKDYFKAYAEASKAVLIKDPNRTYEDSDARLLMERLVYAAECVADGSFTPQSDYNGQYYEDVYELTKDMQP